MGRMTVVRLDWIVVGLLQRVYDMMLDRFDTRIGSFRMLVALLPVCADTLARVSRGCAMAEVLANGVVLVGIGLFYDPGMMRRDDGLQARHDLRAINLRSLRFQVEFLTLRVFYLFSLTAVALLHRNVAGLGLLAIVYARCLVVRARMRPDGRRALALHPA